MRPKKPSEVWFWLSFAGVIVNAVALYVVTHTPGLEGAVEGFKIGLYGLGVSGMIQYLLLEGSEE